MATDPVIDVFVNNQYYGKRLSGLELPFIDLRPRLHRQNLLDYIPLLDWTPMMLVSHYHRRDMTARLARTIQERMLYPTAAVGMLLFHPDEEELGIQTPALWYKAHVSYTYENKVQIVRSIEQTLRFGDSIDSVIEPPPTTLERLRQIVNGLFQT